MYMQFDKNKPWIASIRGLNLVADPTSKHIADMETNILVNEIMGHDGDQNQEWTVLAKASSILLGLDWTVISLHQTELPREWVWRFLVSSESKLWP
jgi:hypothetical protein